MAAKKIVKTEPKKINDEVMTDGLNSYHKQPDGRYLQVGGCTKMTVDMWFAYGIILKPVEV